MLKVAGELKQEIQLDTVIDLKRPGIEKLRLTPAQINNGETTSQLRMEFTLLPKDVDYLDTLGCRWETIIDSGRRWLVVRDHQLPAEYNCEIADIAIEIPTAYPDAAIDMFYCHPALTLRSGSAIPQTEATISIGGIVFQRWSRHLNGSIRWNPQTDSVMTQMAVIEECLLREIET